MFNILATGTFSIYDKNGIMITNRFHLNKIFTVDSFEEGKTKAFAAAEEMAKNVFKNCVEVKQHSDLKIVKHKKREKFSGRSRKLNPDQLDMFAGKNLRQKYPYFSKVGPTAIALTEKIWQRSKGNYSEDDLRWLVKKLPEPQKSWAKKELEIKISLRKRKN